MWARARTRLRDHGSEEGEVGGEGTEERRDIHTLYGPHEEPVGDHRLDRCLESEVRGDFEVFALASATCQTAESIL